MVVKCDGATSGVQPALPRALSVRAAGWKREVVILALAQLGLGLIYLKTVPRFYNDEPWEASLGYSLAYEGVLRHGIIEGWGGIHVRFVQNQVIQPFVSGGCLPVGRV